MDPLTQGTGVLRDPCTYDRGSRPLGECEQFVATRLLYRLYDTVAEDFAPCPAEHSAMKPNPIQVHRLAPLRSVWHRIRPRPV